MASPVGAFLGIPSADGASLQSDLLAAARAFLAEAGFVGSAQEVSALLSGASAEERDATLANSSFAYVLTRETEAPRRRR